MFSKAKTLLGCTAVAAMSVGLAGTANAQVYGTSTDTRDSRYDDRRNNDGGWGLHPYIGANYGLHKSGDGDYDEERDLWEVYGGLAIHRYFALEVNYADLGEQSTDVVDVGIDGWGASIVGQLPFNDQFSLYAKLGQFWWNADVDVNEDDEALNFDFDDNEPFFTVGAGFRVMDPVTITLEYTRFNTDIDLSNEDTLGEPFEDSDASNLDTVKLGVRFAF